MEEDEENIDAEIESGGAVQQTVPTEEDTEMKEGENASPSNGVVVSMGESYVDVEAGVSSTGAEYDGAGAEYDDAVAETLSNDPASMEVNYAEESAQEYTEAPSNEALPSTTVEPVKDHCGEDAGEGDIEMGTVLDEGEQAAAQTADHVSDAVDDGNDDGAADKEKENQEDEEDEDEDAELEVCADFFSSPASVDRCGNDDGRSFTLISYRLQQLLFLLSASSFNSRLTTRSTS